MSNKHHNTTHGQTNPRTPTYTAWRNMRNRCKNPNNNNYKYYGARGIKVCDRWNNSFEAFFEDMGTRPDDLSLDRIDNNQGYSPTNCRWATQTEQANNRRDNRILTFLGKSMPIKDWADLLGINYQVIYNRLKLNWSVAKTLSTPARKYIRAEK